MGVRNLETFLHVACPDACYEVNIEDIVTKYKERHKGVTPVIVVDAMSVLRPLYGKLSWLNGGQFKEFHEIVLKFIEKFTILGCELVLFYDGPTQDIKLPVWKNRRISTATELCKTFSHLSLGRVEAEKKSNSAVLPNGLGSVLYETCKWSKYCKVFKAIRECDVEIAEYASQNECFAILAQDTDYVILRCVEYYLSIKNLNLDKMTTLCYDGVMLARSLNLKPDDLPLLASLLGNDIVSYDSLRPFHQRLTKNCWKDNFPVIRSVSNFIKSAPKKIDLRSVSLSVFRTEEKVGLLEESINSYKVKNQTSKKEETTGVTGETTSAENWNNIISFIKERYVKSTVGPEYDIIINARHTSSTCLENYKETDVYIPCGIVLKDLRRSYYGILLKEKPQKCEFENFVSELIMTGFDSMGTEVPVTPKYLQNVEHPGLLNLLSESEETKKIMDDKRWEILSEVFNISFDFLKELPLRLIIPTLALRYLKNQSFNIESWEYDAVLATNVCVQDYNGSQLSHLPEDPLLYRPIYLFTVITRTYSVVCNLLNGIGSTIPAQVLVFEYVDGKLFHVKYRQSKNGISRTSLCGNKILYEEMLLKLKNTILQ